MAENLKSELDVKPSENELRLIRKSISAERSKTRVCDDPNKSSKSIRKTCPVCEKSPVVTNFYGPGVCHNCRCFFMRISLDTGRLKCSKKGECDVKQQNKNFKSCKKCRFDKCINVGMEFKRMRNINHLKKNPTCEVCRSKSFVGVHYGLDMCIKCAKWYSGIQKKSLIKRFKCSKNGNGSTNKCDQNENYDIKKCSKCRHDKLIRLTQNAKFFL